LVLALVPATLFLLPAGYFASSDGMIHLYRLFELDRAIGEGVFFPRWFPLAAYGYGLPVLNYYPPLMYYLAEVFHLLGAGYIAAIKLTIATTFALAAFSMFLLARAWLSARAAFVAAIAYAYSPYLLSDAYVRGNFPEMLAMSLLPLALASFTPRPSSFVFRPSSFVFRPSSFVFRLSSFVIVFAAIILAHHLTAMQFAALLVVYGLFLFALEVRDWRLEIGDWREEGGHRSAVGGRQSAVGGRQTAVGGRWSAVVGLVAIVVALALTAFYWVPALAELHLVYVESASLARFLVSRLVHPADFFAPALAYTYLPQSDALKRAFGFPQTILALLAGVIALFQVLRFWIRRSRGRWQTIGWGRWAERLPTAYCQLPADVHVSRFTLHVLFFALVVAFSIFMTLTLSAPLWYAIPTLRFMQFPWRFQILATLGIAFLMGVWAQWLSDALARGRAQRFVAPLFALVLIALGIANLPLRAFALDDAQVDLTRADDRAYVVAQMGWGWTREFLPATVREFENIYAPLVKPALSPPDATRAQPSVQIERDGLYARVLRVSAAEPFELSLKAFFFPGWQAYIDGVPARTYPRGSLGIVTVAVPSGEHRVEFRFEDTPLRSMMNVVSLLTLCGVLVAAFVARRRVFVVLLSALIVLAALFAWRASAPRAPTPLAVNATLDARAQLIGYTTERAGESLYVTLHWFALSEMARDYHSYTHLLDATGQLVAQSDGIPDQGLTPTTRWLPGQIVTDRHVIALRDIPPGEYRIAAGMYLPREDGFDNLGNPIALSNVRVD